MSKVSDPNSSMINWYRGRLYVCIVIFFIVTYIIYGIGIDICTYDIYIKHIFGLYILTSNYWYKI